MADERSRPPYNQPSLIPVQYAWPSLLAKDGDELGDAVHVWPFDGWTPPPGKAVIAEVYPSIFRNRYPREDRTGDEQDAYATARWMAEMAALEGWILRGALMTPCSTF